MKRLNHMNTEKNQDTDGISPTLKGLQQNPFSAPAHYFEHLPWKITEQVSHYKPSNFPGKVFSVFNRIPNALTLMIFAIALSTGVWWIPSSNPTVSTELSAETIIKSDILHELDEASLLEISTPSAQNNEAEEYLINNNVDLNLVTNTDLN